MSDADVCCWCGAVTADGIYLRADGRELLACAGHPELSPGDDCARMMTGLALAAFEGLTEKIEKVTDAGGGWRLRLRSPDGGGACHMLIVPVEEEL